MALEFSEAAVKAQINGNTRLQEMAGLFDVPFAELYRMVKDLSGTRCIRAGDRYWLELLGGATVEGIAKKKGCSPAAIAGAVQKAGYDLDSIEQSGEWGYDITLSVRAIEAWRSLGERAIVYFRQKLGETLELVETGLTIERMRLAEEENGQLHLPLVPTDLEFIDELVRHSETDWKTEAPQKGRSKVIRRLIEEMVMTMPELKEYRPPAPLKFPAAYNKIGAGWATTFMAPAYLHREMEEYKGKRGGSSPNLSSFMRDAVEHLLKDPKLVKTGPEPVAYRQPSHFDILFGEPGEKWKFNIPVLTITLLDEQKPRFQQLQQDTGMTERGDLGRLLCKAFMIESGFDQTQLPGWDEYLEFDRPWQAGDREEVRGRLVGLEANGYAVNTYKPEPVAPIVPAEAED